MPSTCGWGSKKYAHLVGYHSPAQATSHVLGEDPNVWHLGFEVRTDEHGELGVKGRRAIDDAVVQAIRGMSGLAQWFSDHAGTVRSAAFAGPSEQAAKLLLMLAVFTTANLWTSAVDLSKADLATGVVPIEKEALKPVPWLFFNLPLASGVRHSIRPARQPKDLADALARHYARTVAIVSSSGIVCCPRSTMSAFAQRARPGQLRHVRRQRAAGQACQLGVDGL